MLQLISITKTGEQWYLNKIIVNPEHISVVQEAPEINSLLREGKIDLGFNEHVVFSKITMSANSGFDELIVASSPGQLLEKMQTVNKRQLLRD